MSTITIKKQTIILISITAILLIASSAVIGYSLSSKNNTKNNNKIETTKVVESKQATEIKEVSEPTKIAIVEESKKKEDIKTVLTPEEVKKVETKVAEKTKSEYTNPYFPTLKLPYTSDWNFINNTNPSQFKDLLIRQIMFTKDKINVIVTLQPVGFYNCGGGDTGKLIVTDLGNKIKKVVDVRDAVISNASVYYGQNEATFCNNGTIVSNIPVDTSSDYKTFNNNSTSTLIKDPTKVNYIFNIEVNETPDIRSRVLIEGSPFTSEVDELIKGFQF